MSEIIVHIGPHKTGTTTIQAVLSENCDVLCVSGVGFSKLGCATVSAQSYRVFSACMYGAEGYPPQGFGGVSGRVPIDDQPYVEDKESAK